MHIKAARIVSGVTRSISLKYYTMRLLAYTWWQKNLPK